MAGWSPRAGRMCGSRPCRWCAARALATSVHGTSLSPRRLKAGTKLTSRNPCAFQTASPCWTMQAINKLSASLPTCAGCIRPECMQTDARVRQTDAHRSHPRRPSPRHPGADAPNDRAARKSSTSHSRGHGPRHCTPPACTPRTRGAMQSPTRTARV